MHTDNTGVDAVLLGPALADCTQVPLSRCPCVALGLDEVTGDETGQEQLAAEPSGRVQNARPLAMAVWGRTGRRGWWCRTVAGRVEDDREKDVGAAEANILFHAARSRTCNAQTGHSDRAHLLPLTPPPLSGDNYRALRLALNIGSPWPVMSALEFFRADSSTARLCSFGCHEAASLFAASRKSITRSSALALLSSSSCERRPWISHIDDRLTTPGTAIFPCPGS